MEERQEEECTSIAVYPIGSGPSIIPKDYDRVFNKSSMEYFGEKLYRYGQSQYC